MLYWYFFKNICCKLIENKKIFLRQKFLSGCRKFKNYPQESFVSLLFYGGYYLFLDFNFFLCFCLGTLNLWCLPVFQKQFVLDMAQILCSRFLVHIGKIMFFPCAFFIFSKFWISKLIWGWKGKKWPKISKKVVHLTLYLRSR